MSAWFDRVYAVIGAVLLCAGAFILSSYLSQGFGAVSVLPPSVFWALALIPLSIPRRITVNAEGVSSWQLFRRQSIPWSAVREIGVGGDLWLRRRGLGASFADPRGRADLAVVYVSPRALKDSERVRVRSIRRDVIWFPYLGSVAPRTGASARMKAALARYDPGVLPEGILTRMDDSAFVFHYVLWRENTDGTTQPEFGVVAHPERA